MLNQQLSKPGNGWLLTLIAGIAAFGAYSCMYAFRKAFASGTFAGLTFCGVDYKIVLVITQVLGYMLSKFYGIKYVSGIAPRNRSRSILILIVVSWLSLLGFALVPVPYNIVFLFFNGLPLGMIWGLVFGFLEGRRNTEVMAVIMASSLVFASGFVKSIGRYILINWHVTEFWMPFITGAIFLLPLCFFVYLLNQIPAPDNADIEARSERKPMTSGDRAEFFKMNWPGLLLIIITYLLLTIVRDLRDNFEVEIWSSLGFGQQPTIFTKIDFPVSLAVLFLLGIMIKVRNNFKAFMYIHLLILTGCMTVFTSTLLYQYHFVGPVVWMSFTAFGLYLAYVPYNSIYFERMIATFRIPGNVGFVMYMADAMGYLGSVSVLLFKQFGFAHISWLYFFIGALLCVSLAGAVSVIFSISYFSRKNKSIISSLQIVVPI